MGLTAVYFGVDDAALESTVGLDGDDLIELIEEWEEEPKEPRYDLYKFWDMLHFALTGKSLSETVYGAPLSEAIIGADGYDADFVIGATKAAELTRIIADLEAVDFDARRADFTLDALAEKDLYPSLGLSTA
ncbi:MAG: YfbM family protein, partial [Bifidobacteriaceae bacterium]|nr:YfbM family protein [Bifidobacteriaceae bacterium]